MGGPSQSGPKGSQLLNTASTHQTSSPKKAYFVFEYFAYSPTRSCTVCAILPLCGDGKSFFVAFTVPCAAIMVSIVALLSWGGRIVLRPIRQTGV